MATDPRIILTSLHGRLIGLNHDKKLVCPGGFVIEGTPGASLEFDENGLLAEVPKAYAQLSDTTDQVPANTDPLLVTHDTQDAITGLQHSGGVITIQSKGEYVVLVGAQVSKASGSALRNLSMWLNVNTADVPNTAVRNGITNLDSTVLILNYVDYFAAGDTIRLYIAADDTTGGIGLYSTTQAGGRPLIPSVMTSIIKLR